MKTQETPLTKELILQLLRNSSPKLQASVLFAISTGMRVSEIAQITPEDIDFTQIPVLIRIRAETTKTKEERETFLTTEATKTLKDYLKRSHGWIEGEKNEHLVGISIFGKAMKNSKYPKLKPTTKILSKKSNLQSILRNAIKKVPELYIKNKNGINTIHFHAFRKYFRTAVGNVCGRDYAETLMGHNFYMDTYYRLSPEQKKELFLKAEPFLTISDYVSVEKELKSLSTKCNTLEDKMAGMMDYFRVNSIPVPEVLK
jgi:integrase